jgi:hypothetical protein
MFKRSILQFILLATGGVAVGFGLRAVAQQAPPAAVPAAAAPAPAATEPVPAVAATEKAPDVTEDSDLRQSADNNISFPVDI